jgi:hypothetical protein
MKPLLLILFVSFATVATAQQNESQRIYNAINAQREKMSLPPLVYRIGEQLSVEERVNQISFNFALSQDCECDYESIAGDNSLQMLVSKMTNISRYQWLHFEEDARFAAIAVVKKEGIFYCVVRTYTN